MTPLTPLTRAPLSVRVSTVAALTVGTALAPASASAQDVLYRYEGGPLEGLGLFAAGVGDVNGDGTQDFSIGSLRDGGVYSGLTGARLFDHFVGAPSGPAPDFDGDGLADLLLANVVYSGAGAGLIHVFDTAPALPFGPVYSVAVDDVDGDGIADVLLGSPQLQRRCGGDVVTNFVGGPGFASVHSGDGGALLYLLMDESTSAFGGLIASAGDLDRDGTEDFVVGALLHSPCGTTGSRFLRALSAVDGATLWTIDEAPEVVSDLGDADGDGVADLALGFPRSDRVQVHSGADGTLLYQVQEELDSRFGASLARVADQNDDGVDDLLVGAYQQFDTGLSDRPPVGPGFVRVLSAVDGTALFTIQGSREGEWFGRLAAPLGDLNADGALDLLVASPRSDAAGEDAGLVQVISASSLPLTADVHELSATAATPQTLILDPGPGYAGGRAVLFGSGTGIRPGDGHPLPVVPDRYTRANAPFGAHPPLVEGLGELVQLDGEGRAQVELRFPPELALALVGRSFFHAFLVLPDAEAHRPGFVSQPVPITLRP